jgi:MerR family transcriptional regulator, light-induced transcriptional regulator
VRYNRAVRIVPTDAQAEARDDFVAALERGDAQLAELVALDALAEGMSVATLYVEVIAPALERIGHHWELGRMTIADEHLATGIAYDVMQLVAPAATAHPRRSRERVLLAAVGSEAHVTGLRMIGDLAAGHGFDVRYLGAAVPVDDLAAVVARHEPEVVGLSVTMAGPARQLAGALDEVGRSGHAPRGVLVGGAGVPDAVRERDDVHYARDARHALAILERLARPAG